MWMTTIVHSNYDGDHMYHWPQNNYGGVLVNYYINNKLIKKQYKANVKKLGRELLG